MNWTPASARIVNAWQHSAEAKRPASRNAAARPSAPVDPAREALFSSGWQVTKEDL